MSDDGVLPSDAVDVSAGGPADAAEATRDAVGDHATAEGAETASSSGMGSTSTLREMLLSTDPSPSLAEVDSPWDPDLGGPSRIYRAVLKIGSFDGMPAIADLTIGVAETLQTVSLDEVDVGDQDDGGDDSATIDFGGDDAV